MPSNEQFLGISYDAPKPLAVMRIQGRVEPKMPIKFLAAADRLTSWCSSAALPMWSSRGIDSAHRFVEQISQQGLAEADVNRRVRVQFRQYYFLGLSSDLLETAEQAMTQAIADSFDEDDPMQERGCALLLSADGSTLDSTRDLYTQAFYLLALAWRFRLSGDSKWLEAADREIAFLEKEMASPQGGYIESIPDRLPRRQNPHMHLFEAFLALHDASGAARYLSLADRIFHLFEAHFFSHENDCIIEYFTKDWQPDPLQGSRIEPGHMMEWAWLVDQYAKQSGRSVGTYSQRLYLKAREIGLDPATGLLVDEVRADGTPLRRTRRSWPQTEYIKAATVLAQAGYAPALDHATFVIETLLDTYLNTGVPGIWRDSYNADGSATDNPAPASTFYHYMSAIGAVSDLVRAIRTASLEGPYLAAGDRPEYGENFARRSGGYPH